MLLFDAVAVSGLLIVTNFPTCSAALLVDGFAFAALTAAGLAWATGLVGTAFAGDACLTATGFAGGDFAGGDFAGAAFAGAGLTTLLAGLAGTAFFDGGCLAALLTAVFEPGFDAPALAAEDLPATGFTGFFAAGLALAAGLAEVLRAAPATALARTGAFVAFAWLPEFFLLFAIPKPILVTRRSRVIA
ncbi:MAG: hypothetical protein ABIQ70_07470 [Dokdonella sp.]